ncbi:hypothetical protein R1flu_005877 [Riccia fluitans]|uniref:Uncharacterized protein n=1 Tax=Riccia fluitans TaxID=41844 RepID=A0ABD1YUG1_9MARC
MDVDPEAPGEPTEVEAPSPELPYIYQRCRIDLIPPPPGDDDGVEALFEEERYELYERAVGAGEAVVITRGVNRKPLNAKQTEIFLNSESTQELMWRTFATLRYEDAVRVNSLQQYRDFLGIDKIVSHISNPHFKLEARKHPRTLREFIPFQVKFDCVAASMPYPGAPEYASRPQNRAGNLCEVLLYVIHGMKLADDKKGAFKFITRESAKRKIARRLIQIRIKDAIRIRTLDDLEDFAGALEVCQTLKEAQTIFHSIDDYSKRLCERLYDSGAVESYALARRLLRQPRVSAVVEDKYTEFARLAASYTRKSQRKHYTTWAPYDEFLGVGLVCEAASQSTRPPRYDAPPKPSEVHGGESPPDEVVPKVDWIEVITNLAEKYEIPVEETGLFDNIDHQQNVGANTDDQLQQEQDAENGQEQQDGGNEREQEEDAGNDQEQQHDAGNRQDNNMQEQEDAGNDREQQNVVGKKKKRKKNKKNKNKASTTAADEEDPEADEEEEITIDQNEESSTKPSSFNEGPAESSPQDPPDGGQEINEPGRRKTREEKGKVVVTSDGTTQGYDEEGIAERIGHLRPESPTVQQREEDFLQLEEEEDSKRPRINRPVNSGSGSSSTLTLSFPQHPRQLHSHQFQGSSSSSATRPSSTPVNQDTDPRTEAAHHTPEPEEIQMPPSDQNLQYHELILRGMDFLKGVTREILNNFVADDKRSYSAILPRMNRDVTQEGYRPGCKVWLQTNMFPLTFNTPEFYSYPLYWEPQSIITKGGLHRTCKVSLWKKVRAVSEIQWKASNGVEPRNFDPGAWDLGNSLYRYAEIDPGILKNKRTNPLTVKTTLQTRISRLTDDPDAKQITYWQMFDLTDKQVKLHIRDKKRKNVMTNMSEIQNIGCKAEDFERWENLRDVLQSIFHLHPAWTLDWIEDLNRKRLFFPKSPTGRPSSAQDLARAEILASIFGPQDENETESNLFVFRRGYRSSPRLFPTGVYVNVWTCLAPFYKPGRTVGNAIHCVLNLKFKEINAKPYGGGDLSGQEIQWITHALKYVRVETKLAKKMALCPPRFYRIYGFSSEPCHRLSVAFYNANNNAAAAAARNRDGQVSFLKFCEQYYKEAYQKWPEMQYSRITRQDFMLRNLPAVKVNPLKDYYLPPWALQIREGDKHGVKSSGILGNIARRRRKSLYRDIGANEYMKSITTWMKYWIETYVVQSSNLEYWMKHSSTHVLL